jgi:hypothetical protein
MTFKSNSLNDNLLLTYTSFKKEIEMESLRCEFY